MVFRRLPTSMMRSFRCWRPIHIIAPDYPGFGQSDAPDPSDFSYTFDHLAKVMDDLLTQLNIERYSL